MQTQQPISTGINIPVKQVEVNGTNLAYIERGTGEAVVFIHGAVSDFRTWFDQFETFSENFRAISYSRRYHQPNEKADKIEDYSRALHTNDLIGFLKALNLKKAHLVGHSYGAAIALLAALQQPELVGSLVLGEPSPFPELLDEEETLLLSEQKAGFEEAMRTARNDDNEEAVRKFLHTIIGVDVLGLLPDERCAVALENADTLLPTLATYYDSPPLSRKKLKNLNVPALLITGALSPQISRVSDEAIFRFLPNSETAVLQCASHGLQIENPKKFNSLVLEFYNRHNFG